MSGTRRWVMLNNGVRYECTCQLPPETRTLDRACEMLQQVADDPTCADDVRDFARGGVQQLRTQSGTKSDALGLLREFVQAYLKEFGVEQSQETAEWELGRIYLRACDVVGGEFTRPAPECPQVSNEVPEGAPDTGGSQLTLNPLSQVMFRAGLIACREYMARFVEPQSPEIAASIRANWWPSLGPDFGPPRKIDWGELTRGEWGTSDFRCLGADEVSPTLEALPHALGFLVQTSPPGAYDDLVVLRTVAGQKPEGG